MMIVFVACGTKKDQVAQKQSEEELRNEIVGKWKLVINQDSVAPTQVDSTNNSMKNSSKAVGEVVLSMIFKENGDFEENRSMILTFRDNSANFPDYNIQGHWEIKGDTLIRKAERADVKNPEILNISGNGEIIISKYIIQRLSIDSLILSGENNLLELVRVKE